MPPCERLLRTWKRVSGTVASSMSSTLTPDRLMPAMSARLSARAMRLVSRLAVIVAPFGIDVLYAIARRTTTSGLTSTLARPRTPRRPKSVRGAAALPHDRRRDHRTGLDRLERIHLHVGVDHRVLADEALVADDGALVDAHVRTKVGVASDHAAPQVGALAHVHVVVQHRTFDERVGLHDHVGAEHRVGTQVHAGLDAAAVADHDRIVDAGLGTDLDVGADPAPLAELEAVDLHVDAPVEHVGVGAAVGLERADVLPVALGDVAVQRVAVLEQRREHVAGEVDDLALGDVVEHHRFEHVDPGVDGVGEHLTPRGLLEEALDRAVGLGDDDAELERVLHVLERDRRRTRRRRGAPSRTR